MLFWEVVRTSSDRSDPRLLVQLLHNTHPTLPHNLFTRTSQQTIAASPLQQACPFFLYQLAQEFRICNPTRVGDSVRRALECTAHSSLESSSFVLINKRDNGGTRVPRRSFHHLSIANPHLASISNSSHHSQQEESDQEQRHGISTTENPHSLSHSQSPPLAQLLIPNSSQLSQQEPDQKHHHTISCSPESLHILVGASTVPQYRNEGKPTERSYSLNLDDH
ncbi:uncharacterized protein FTJAE_5036 [Fusarium tjaetaba]|uniref:Uncharacterized protein n=1 Tax=Fusarium tjaetaba TaxID=1567544 RepID=A0A8H5RP35_9HYPO|nr:uncharacterized protein FTJAE_5036 [Fusarium tjaetaba]KAF5638965.1 hypothetical protein FTJAE_5036 [Fusarium tjaetaba]